VTLSSICCMLDGEYHVLRMVEFCIQRAGNLARPTIARPRCANCMIKGRRYFKRSNQKTLMSTSLLPEVVGPIRFSANGLRFAKASVTNWTRLRLVSHSVITGSQSPAFSSAGASTDTSVVVARQSTSYTSDFRSLLFFLLFTHHFFSTQSLPRRALTAPLRYEWRPTPSPRMPISLAAARVLLKTLGEQWRIETTWPIWDSSKKQDEYSQGLL
jgi:hypothetical protein